MKLFGDYHLHSNFSRDGRATIIEMVRAAKDKGMQEIAITEHGFGAWYNGMRKKNFEKWQGDIESARADMPVLMGIEANLVSHSGKIDIDDEDSKKFDIVLFGVHLAVLYSVRAFFFFFVPNMFWKLVRWTPKGRKRKNTQAVINAIENNRIDVWVHPNRYFRLNVIEVAEVCAKRGTLLELNSKKISFRPIDFERMIRVGAKFIINSDAHNTSRIGETARVEEFLKNCDYNEDDIINLKKTFTEYKKKNDNNNAGRNQEQNPEQKQRRWGRRG